MTNAVMDIIDRIIFRIKNQGLLSLVEVVVQKLIWAVIPPRLAFYEKVFRIVHNSIGLEIGGPSYIFSKTGYIPIYVHAKNVDNTNFAHETIWEGRIKEGVFTYEKRTLGRQFVRDAVALEGLKDESYDFIITSEMIGLIANPLRALAEWKRVLKKGGHMILVLANKEKTFDHRRPITEMQHIVDDQKRNTQEDDLTHLAEVLKYHDLSRDRLAGTFEQFKVRCENNHKFRALNHHVFDEKRTIEMVEYAGFDVLESELFSSVIIFLAKKA